MKNNLSLDVHSKLWWTSIISLSIVLAQQIGHLFGWEITGDTANQVMAIVNTMLSIGGALGLIYNTGGNNETKV